IDNQPGLDRGVMDQAVNYVVQALAEARAGKPVSVPATDPYGCSVKY
ncbi:MAG: thioredoxin family protein, partial [Lentisphaerae bacterium]|nr:thioredoxin family protein [Lentisphaerota bacterium]